MIPYDDLVASLTSWRERQGLPVHREDLFEVDASAGLLGVAEALATPLVPESSPGADDTGETRLATADVVAAEEENPGLADFGEDDGESTYIGSSPAWRGDEVPPDAPAESPWGAAGDDATGESPVAPPALGQEDAALGDAIDAALPEGDPTPDVPPQDPVAADEETFVADATAVRSPTDGDAPAGDLPAAAVDPDPAGDPPAPEPDGEPAIAWAHDQELAADDAAIVGEADANPPSPFQDGATAIRDPADAGPTPFDLPPADPELDVDLGDVLESEADPNAGDGPSGDDHDGDDPFRP